MATTIRGVNAVVRNLEALGKDIESAVRKTQMRAALEIEREAVARVRVISGRLKGSIMTQEVGDGVKVGTDVEYAHFVEFGTSKQAARPYLQPAVEIVKHKYPEMVIDDVKAGVR